jgi:hypothetical protein
MASSKSASDLILGELRKIEEAHGCRVLLAVEVLFF